MYAYVHNSKFPSDGGRELTIRFSFNFVHPKLPSTVGFI